MGKEPVGIVHGDYRIGNVILHPTEPRVISVLVRHRHCADTVAHQRAPLRSLLLGATSSCVLLLLIRRMTRRMIRGGIIIMIF